MERRKFRRTFYIMLLIIILIFVSFHLKTETNLKFLPEEVCLCLQFSLLPFIEKGGCFPFRPKYKWAHVIFRAMLPLSLTCLPFWMWLIFQSHTYNMGTRQWHSSKTWSFGRQSQMQRLLIQRPGYLPECIGYKLAHDSGVDKGRMAQGIKTLWVLSLSLSLSFSLME